MAEYFEPFPKSTRGDGFKNMASYRKHPHRGVDWSVPANKVIKGITTGRVKFVGESAELGYYLIQATADGRFISYCHLAKPSSRAVGDMIIGGVTPIGLVGSTGTTSTGAHLHCHFGTVQNLASAPMDKLEDLFAHIEANPPKPVPPTGANSEGSRE